MKTKALTAAQIDTLAQRLSDTPIEPSTSAKKAGEAFARLLAARISAERAKVLDHALKDLGSDVKTFGVLLNKSEAISAAGNKLEADANAAIVDDATKIRQYLTLQANMKGPVSDALRKAAEAVRSGSTVAAAAKGFIRDSKQALSGTGNGSQAPAPGGSTDEVSPAVEPEAVAPDEDAGDDLFAAMLPPTSKPVLVDKTQKSNDKPQDDLLSALTPTPQGKSPAEVKAEAEAKVKAQQSKIGTTVPQADSGALFNTQSDIEKPADAVPDQRWMALAIKMRNRLAPFMAGTENYLVTNAEDLSETLGGRNLMTDLAAVSGLEPRKKIADDWVVKRGNAGGAEHMVVLDKDGIPLAITRGDRSNGYRKLHDDHPRSGLASGHHSVRRLQAVNSIFVAGKGAMAS